MLKHLSGLRYILSHKYYMFLECIKVGLFLESIIHDWNKFLPKQWFPYIEHFHGGNTTIKGDAYDPSKDKDVAFKLAWADHIHRNDHHWQHYVVFGRDLKLEALPMPLKNIKKMVCDWKAASKAQKNHKTVKEWYLENIDYLILHPETRGVVENMLGV